jgi:hypothetical protein
MHRTHFTVRASNLKRSGILATKRIRRSAGSALAPEVADCIPWLFLSRLAFYGWKPTDNSWRLSARSMQRVS